MSVVCKRLAPYTIHGVRRHCKARKTYKCKLLVVGGGTGGCSVAWRFSRRLKENDIILLEPSTIHFYQPAFTLVAAGEKTLDQSYKCIPKILPKSVTWLHDKAENFEPSQNLVHTWNGDKIYYEYMVIAVGLKNDYEKVIGLQKALDNPSIPVSTIYSPFYCTKTWQNIQDLISFHIPQVIGLQKALDNPSIPVSTIYSPFYCTKTWRNIQEFSGGHALFTFPVMGGKCAGAAMKIMFLAQDYWRMKKIVSKTNITYNTGAPAMFGIPKYSDVLKKLAANRGIVPNYCTHLVEVSPEEAVFLGPGGETIRLPYNILHVTPPMSPPCCLGQCEGLADATGYLDVDVHTLQHKLFPNVFGLGDCTNTPNGKTASAVAPQSCVLERNLADVMAGKKPTTKYDGYSACPLLTSYTKGILAEFIYCKKIWETFPFDQSKESRLIYQLNKHVFPPLYWRCLIKGKWNGPCKIRRILNPFRK